MAKVPSASLQARIAAFEKLSSHATTTTTILDSDPTSPLLSFPPLTPRSSSPPVLGRKTSLIDLSELELVVSSAPPRTASADERVVLPPRVPPLPPRKPSQNSLKSWLPSKGPLALPVRSSPISIASSKLFHPDPLSEPMPASHSSDGSSRHLPASSISSFQSVSLSSEGLATTGTGTDNSLDGSYEAVSSTAAISPIQPAPLSLNESSHTLTRRRPPPPPPTKPQPQKTVVAQPALLRPVPIPVNARKRYDALFERYTSQKRPSTSGWRGPSLDLLTGTDIVLDTNENANARMDGHFVKSIWVCSRLPRSRLREIWDECDTDSTGSLDKSAFALGMWRIDEALRAAHQSRYTQTQTQSPPLPRRSPNVAYIPRPPPTRTSQK